MFGEKHVESSSATDAGEREACNDRQATAGASAAGDASDPDDPPEEEALGAGAAGHASSMKPASTEEDGGHSPPAEEAPRGCAGSGEAADSVTLLEPTLPFVSELGQRTTVRLLENMAHHWLKKDALSPLQVRHSGTAAL